MVRWDWIGWFGEVSLLVNKRKLPRDVPCAAELMVNAPANICFPSSLIGVSKYTCID